MYNQPEKVLEQYDITVHQITKGRGSYICESEQGMKLLLPFRGSCERAEFISDTLSCLRAHDWEAEEMIRTTEGEILSKDENGNRYLLKEYVSGAECNPKSREEMTQAVKLLAAFHLLCRECLVEIPEFMRQERGNLYLQYEKHNRELIKVRNYVKGRKRKNEFEMKFQRQYPHFMEYASLSLTLLHEETPKAEDYGLCHGQFNQHNVIRTKSGFRMMNYEEMGYYPQVTDLANFMRKMLEKNDWNEELGFSLLESYEKVRPLTACEYKQLYIILLFPEKFWKIANHYYNSHKAWLSGRDIDKLDKVIAQEDLRVGFLEKLFSFIA